MGKKKSKIIPDYLKKTMKGTTVGTSVGVFDDEFVTSPKIGLNIGKGKTKVTSSVEKSFSKVDKRNINSAITLGITRGNLEEGDSSQFSLSGTKRGKAKNFEFEVIKKFQSGGEARGGGAAIKGLKFKGVF